MIDKLQKLPVALMASLGIHLLAIGLISLFSGSTDAAPLQKVIVAELVVKAPKQNKRDLPRRIRTVKKKHRAKQKKRKPAVSVAERKLASEALQKTLKEVDQRQAQDTAAEALARLAKQDQTGDDPDEARGNPKGSDQGTKSDGELLEMTKGYLADCARAIREHPAYAIPDTLNQSQRVSLRIELFLRIGADGKSLEVKVVKPSGHSIFDRDMLAVAKMVRFPQPPKELVSRMALGVTAEIRP